MKKTYKIALFVIILTVVMFATTTGPNFPTVATGNTNAVGGGTVAWISPGSISAADSVFANCVPGVAITDDLIGNTFGFTIPTTDTINGITLEINANTPATTNIEKFNNVRIIKGGVVQTTEKATAATFVVSQTTFTFGGIADLWGTTWTPADINAANFGALANTVSTGGGPGTVQIDFFRITITSTPQKGASFMPFLLNSKRTTTITIHKNI